LCTLRRTKLRVLRTRFGVEEDRRSDVDLLHPLFGDPRLVTAKSIRVIGRDEAAIRASHLVVGGAERNAEDSVDVELRFVLPDLHRPARDNAAPRMFRKK
jgi:hypothetical protein